MQGSQNSFLEGHCPSEFSYEVNEVVTSRGVKIYRGTIFHDAKNVTICIIEWWRYFYDMAAV